MMELKDEKGKSPCMSNEKDLEQQALHEILLEAKRGKTRAEEVGPSGWERPKLASTNKRFLHNTLLNTLSGRARELSNAKYRKKVNKGEMSSSKDAQDKEVTSDSKTEQNMRSTKMRHHHVTNHDSCYKTSFHRSEKVSTSDRHYHGYRKRDYRSGDSRRKHSDENDREKRKHSK